MGKRAKGNQIFRCQEREKRTSSTYPWNVNFAGLNIKCDKRALIPRPETETLVEHILQRIDPSYDGIILDMGTGSGAILAALCFSLPSSSGIGIDYSQEALSLAGENLKALSLLNRTQLRQLDWNIQKVEEEMVGLVVSNPLLKRG